MNLRSKRFTQTPFLHTCAERALSLPLSFFLLTSSEYQTKVGECHLDCEIEQIAVCMLQMTAIDKISLVMLLDLQILGYFGGCLSENIPFTITHLCKLTKEKYCLCEGHNPLYDMTTFPSVPGRAIKTKVCSFLSFFSFKFSRI